MTIITLRSRFQILILQKTNTCENRWAANGETWFLSALNISGELYSATFNFSYLAFCLYSMGSLKNPTRVKIVRLQMVKLGF